MFSKSVGIDLGTATVSIYINGRGIVFSEPSVVAVDMTCDKVIAAGNAAQSMLGRTPPQIKAVRPIEAGVISSYTMTDAMLSEMLKKVKNRMGSAPRVMMCVPSGVTDVEQRAVIEAARAIGAKEIYIIEEPMAAAIGAGINVTDPKGSMVVDIGGGTTDIAVICAGHIVSGRSIKIAGDEFTAAIVRYIRRAYNLNIGNATAELVKKTIGTLGEPDNSKTMVVKGLSTVSGLPKGVLIKQSELTEDLYEVMYNIIERIKDVLEETSPRLQADILESGITLAGGGALLEGVQELIQERTGVNVNLAQEPVTCIAQGAGMAFNYISDETEPTFGRFYKKAYIYK